MPPFFENSKPSPQYPEYYERIVETLKKRAAEGRYPRYYYGLSDDIEEIKALLLQVSAENGIFSTIAYRRSCVSDSTDMHDLVTVSLYYPDSVHTATYVAPKDPSVWEPVMESVRLNVTVANRD